MAKLGRKLTASRSERYLGGYSNGHVQVRNDSSELLEEDVWSTIDNSDLGNDNSFGNTAGRARRRSLRDERLVDGMSRAVQDSGRAAETPASRHVAASAPVNVPDWSKILRSDSVELRPEMEDGESEMVPPHEYLAREYRNAAATSVFEGVGRTLKGRDMRRVRDAVWSRTGFNG